MKKNILIIMETLGGGGAEKVLTDLLKRIDLSKFNIDLFLAIYEGVYIKEVPGEVNIKYIFNKRSSFWLVKKLTTYLHLNFFLKAIVNLKIRKTYDLEISFMQGVSLKFHSLLNSKSRKVTWVHMDLSDENWLNDPFFPYAEAKLAYSKMNRIIFVSQDALNVFNTLFNVSGDKEVFYNPIDKEEIIKKSNENAIKKSKLTICAIGRLGPQKGMDRLVRVAGRLKDVGLDFKIWIIGTGYAEQALKRLSVELSLENTVEFLGYKENPYPYLKEADIFISTSLAEGFSLVVAEAMCLGKPVISTTVTGPTELLDNGKYGILTSHDDDAIFAALKQVMENKDLRKELGHKSLERSSIFDIKKSIKDFERILEI